MGGPGQRIEDHHVAGDDAEHHLSALRPVLASPERRTQGSLEQVRLASLAASNVARLPCSQNREAPDTKRPGYRMDSSSGRR